MQRSRSFDAQLLAERHRLLALARVLVHGSGAEADDLVQSAVVKALDREEPPRELGTWLRRVLRNEARGRIRKRKLREARANAAPEAMPMPTQEEAAAESEVAAAVWQALDALEEPYRATIRRRFLDEMSANAIAEADGEVAATVRWRVHEGLRRMRARLDERFEGRAQWCSGFAVVLGLPGSTTVGATVSTSSILKITLVLATIAGLVTAARLADDDEVTAEDASQSAMHDSALIVADPEAIRDTSTQHPVASANEAAVVLSPEAPASGQDSTEADPRRLLGRGIRDCIEGAPDGSLHGLQRIELDFHTFGADEGAVWHGINATTGRKIPGTDEDCTEIGPVDAPGVIQHEEIRQCLWDTIDPRWLPVPIPFVGEYSGIGGHIVHLDGEGHVRRPPPKKHAEPLPDVSDETVLDPHHAAEELALAKLGPEAAKIQIVECGAYDCRFCKKSEETLATIRERYPDLATAWLNMPSRSPAAVLAAKASVAATRQGKFWELHRAMFVADTLPDRAGLIALAEQQGIERSRFEQDLDADDTAREVARHKRTCESAGAWATPTFFVNGDMIRGELGVEPLAKVIDDLIALEN